MDRRRPLAAFLILLAGAATPLPLRDANWIAPERRAAALSRDPGECLTLPSSPQERLAVQVGRAAFATPVLLGGQAARVGLSCASCHRNGRGNPDFAFPGLSGAPGTADVTSSLMSRTRGDGTVNPVRIPDLATDRPKIARDADRPDLRIFIRGLIVEEFDGPEPAAAVLDGVTAYVRALVASACPAGDGVQPSLARSWGDIALAVSAAEALMQGGDRASARLMLASARAELGRADERYAGIGTAQRRIAKLDAGLRDIQLALDAGDPIDRLLGRWRAGFAAAGPILQRAEPRSLFNAARLADALR
jgi:hypothetical protein